MHYRPKVWENRDTHLVYFIHFQSLKLKLVEKAGPRCDTKLLKYKVCVIVTRVNSLAFNIVVQIRVSNFSSFIGIFNLLIASIGSSNASVNGIATNVDSTKKEMKF